MSGMGGFNASEKMEWPDNRRQVRSSPDAATRSVLRIEQSLSSLALTQVASALMGATTTTSKNLVNAQPHNSASRSPSVAHSPPVNFLFPQLLGGA